MPRSSNPDAMARRDSQPAACSSLMVGARSIARLWARACRADCRMPAAATTLPSKRTNEPSAEEMSGLHSRQDGAPAPAPTVLIVGTGPAGLFAACELLRHGVKPRVVERRLTPH